MSLGYQILAQSGRRERFGADKGMDTAFVVARDVSKGFAGILNAVVPGVGTAASGITQMWMDPLQQEITKKPVVKDNKPSAFLTPAAGAGAASGGGSTEEKKVVLAEKAVLEAQAAKAKADAKPGDVKLAAEAKAAVEKAKVLAVEAKILLPVSPSSTGATLSSVPAKNSVWPKIAIGSAVVGGVAIIALVLKYVLGGRS